MWFQSLAWPEHLPDGSLGFAVSVLFLLSPASPVTGVDIGHTGQAALALVHLLGLVGYSCLFLLPWVLGQLPAVNSPVMVLLPVWPWPEGS